MIGVSFQPGQGGYGAGNGNGQSQSASDGVQEAIKVLSLRLPRVVGAQGIAPQALLESMGSGGSRVDSVVNQVLSRMFPTGGQMPPMQSASFGMAPNQPTAPDNAPNFSGSATAGYGGPRKEETSITSASFLRPRVVFENPQNPGDFSVGADGRPKTSPFGGGIFESLPGADFNQRPAMIAPTPQWPPMGGGSYQEPENPLF